FGIARPVYFHFFFLIFFFNFFFSSLALSELSLSLSLSLSLNSRLSYLTASSVLSVSLISSSLSLRSHCLGFHQRYEN
ncbi:MAG: hypothetical protein J8272_00860, partial ['Prunus persica' phytoplasma PP2]|nr:hypothetical protein ['Prunus persica' phytoplasma PP2]